MHALLLAASLWVNGNYTNAAGTRAYKLYVPAGYTQGERRPLLVAIHGCTETPDDFAGLAHLAKLADEQRLLVLMPAQSITANASLCWNWFLPVNQKRGQGEPSIIKGMIDWTREHYSVDDSRIYVAGVSSGGFMTSVMLSCYAETFAAGMVASGGMYEAADDVYSGAYAAIYGSAKDPNVTGADADRCSNHAKPAPVLVFHGALDPYVKSVNADLVIAAFAQMNDLADDGKDNDSMTAKATSVTNTNGYALKVFPFGAEYMMSGMGHAWSGGDQNFVYAYPQGVDETAIMWSFLSQYTREPRRRRAS